MMNTKSKSITYLYEKFKAFLLVFLIILCIVQIGILWSSQSGSLPFSLFSNSKSTTPASIDYSKTGYLLPYRVVISTGFNGDHYLIPNGSKEYKMLWNGATLYIEQALETKPKQIQPFSEDVWGTLVAKKPYTFEFKTQIPIDIVKWTLNLDSKKYVGEGLSGIYKVVICPDDSDNNYSDILYIRDKENIYTYELKDFKVNALSNQEFKSINTNQQNNANSKSYQMTIEMFRKDQISLDLLGKFSSNSKESYPDITCQPIEGLAEQEYTYENLNKIGQNIFGNARNAYDPDMDVNGSVVFKKADGVYRLYKNSILEYSFTGNEGNTQALSVLEAYKKSIAFLLEQKSQNDIMSDVSVYLNSIEDKKGSYIFNFDYSLSLGEEKGEIPILLKDYQIPNSNNKLGNSISIEASSDRVLKFKWLALKFEVGKGLKNYEWNFGNMYNETRNTYTELKKGEVFLTDYGVYYVLNYPKVNEHIITPSFVLFTKDGPFDILMEGNNK